MHRRHNPQRVQTGEFHTIGNPMVCASGGAEIDQTRASHDVKYITHKRGSYGCCLDLIAAEYFLVVLYVCFSLPRSTWRKIRL